MRAYPMVLAAVLICLGLTTACERSTPGTIAMTTEPGTTTSTTTPSTSTPTKTRSTAPSTPVVPAPQNALTMTCGEFIKLDDATQLAVVKAIIADERSVVFSGNEQIAVTLAQTICSFGADATVSEVLGGTPG